jgi:hypothetical protein
VKILFFGLSSIGIVAGLAYSDDGLTLGADGGPAEVIEFMLGEWSGIVGCPRRMVIMRNFGSRKVLSPAQTIMQFSLTARPMPAMTTGSFMMCRPGLAGR